jgi:hypothetical protein
VGKDSRDIIREPEADGAKVPIHALLEVGLDHRHATQQADRQQRRRGISAGLSQHLTSSPAEKTPHGMGNEIVRQFPLGPFLIQSPCESRQAGSIGAPALRRTWKKATKHRARREGPARPCVVTRMETPGWLSTTRKAL